MAEQFPRTQSFIASYLQLLKGEMEEQIEAAKTPKGGWTKAQLAAWGVPWPPPKGWKKALINGDPIPGQRKDKST